MSRLFMGGRGLWRPVRLDQDKPGRIVLLLHNVKACDSWFPNARTRVGERRLFERFDHLRLYSNLNMDDKHNVPFTWLVFDWTSANAFDRENQEG